MVKCVKNNNYQRVVVLVMVLTQEKEVARKITIFCELLKMGNAVVLARLCNKINVLSQVPSFLPSVFSDQHLAVPYNTHIFSLRSWYYWVVYVYLFNIL